MPIKTLGSLGKIRVGRVTGNTHIFFGPYHWNISLQKYTPKFAPNIGKKVENLEFVFMHGFRGRGGLDFLGFGILKLCCTRPGRKLGPLPPPPPPPPHTHTRKFSGSAHGIRILKKAISP